MVVVHQGALGDFLLALPAIEGLAACFPGLKIDFLSKPRHVALLASKTYLGTVEPHDGPALAPFFHEDLWKDASIPAILQNRDAVLIFGQSAGRSAAERLSLRLPCPVHFVRSFPEPGHGRHVTEFILERMHRLGWFPAGFNPPVVSIAASSKDGSAVREWLAQKGFGEDNRPFLIHPGSGGHRKIWPLAGWWALLHELSRRRIPVLMALGPADAALEAFAGEARKLGVVILRDLSLTRLCALLGESRMYVGNDSGVSHLAALTGVASVVIFGPTDPDVWSPRGPDVRIVRSRWEESEVFSWSPAVPPSLPEARVAEVFQTAGI